LIAIQKDPALSKPGVDKLAAAGWALILGLLCGLACVGIRLFFRLLQWLFTQHWGSLPAAAIALSPERRLLTPLIGAACATAVLLASKRWFRVGHFEEYVEAVRFRGGRITLAPTLWRTASSAFSVATGASIGREGSMIQFSTAVASWIGARSPIRSLPLARQVAYGAAAAVAAAYQAPIAGIFFSMEIVLGERAWNELPNLALASTAGWFVSRTLLGGGPLFAVSGNLALSRAALWAVPLALVLGLVAPAYQKLIRSLRFTGRWPLALLLGGLSVGLLGLHHASVWGNGDVALLEILRNGQTLSMVATVLALRLAATIICVGTGTAGGVFTPTLFAGAALGFLSSQLLHLPQPMLLAVIGLSALLAAVTHAPIMATFMAAELTGQWHLLPMLFLLNLLALIVARSISSHSLYAIASPDPAQ
jgi:chloride channel protein, CIC family